MGFSQEIVLDKQPSLWGEFVCAVCQGLPQSDPVIVKCDHIFCRSCLERWLGECERAGRQKTCPKCRVVIAESENSTHAKSHVRPLKDANPLAHRLYQKIVVRCPLEGLRCGWRGELSEVLAHCSTCTGAKSPSGAAAASGFSSSSSSSSTSSSSSAPSSKASASGSAHGSSSYRQAIALKEQANSFFASGQLSSALQLYTRAIKLSPGIAVLYSNRAACQLALARFEHALRDCNACIDICEKDADRRAHEGFLWKVYKRKSEALAEMGRFSAAVEAVRRGLSSIDIDTSSSTSNPSQKRKHKEVAAKAHEVLNERLKMAATMQRLGEEGEACLARKDYKRANALFARLLTFTRAPAVSLGQAQCQIHLGSVSLALSRTLAVLRVAKKSGNSEIMGKALLVRAAALMANADFPAAVDCLRAVVRSDPDSSRGKASLRSALAMSRTVQDAKSKQAKRDFDAAVESLTSAILIAGWDDWSARQGKERGEEGKEGKEEGNEKGEEKKEKEGGLDFPLVSALGASIFAARAEARLRLGRLEECLVDADVAIYCAADCKEAWKSKANALMKLGREEEAAQSLQPLFTQDSWGAQDPVLSSVYQRACFEVRKKRRPDYYALLGLVDEEEGKSEGGDAASAATAAAAAAASGGASSAEEINARRLAKARKKHKAINRRKTATTAEIKHAYKRMAVIHHPDKVIGKEAKERAQARFKLMQEALEVLTDERKRQWYDEGHDFESIKEMTKRTEEAARRGHHGHSHGH